MLSLRCIIILRTRHATSDNLWLRTTGIKSRRLQNLLNESLYKELFSRQLARLLRLALRGGGDFEECIEGYPFVV